MRSITNFPKQPLKFFYIYTKSHAACIEILSKQRRRNKTKNCHLQIILKKKKNILSIFQQIKIKKIFNCSRWLFKHFPWLISNIPCTYVEQPPKEFLRIHPTIVQIETSVAWGCKQPPPIEPLRFPLDCILPTERAESAGKRTYARRIPRRETRRLGWSEWKEEKKTREKEAEEWWWQQCFLVISGAAACVPSWWGVEI